MPYQPPVHVDCTSGLPSQRNEVAVAWQLALRIQRDVLLPNGALVPKVLPNTVTTPYLGWVGEAWRGGTLVLARNPGGGGRSETEQAEHDKRVQDAICALRDGRPDDARHLFDRLTFAYSEQAPQIGMGKLLDRILFRLDEARTEIAFLNILPYRTLENEHASAGAMRLCMELVVVPILQQLRPDTVVVLGSEDTTAESKLWFSAEWVYSVRRPRKDKDPIPPDGCKALERVEADNARGGGASAQAERCEVG